MEHYDIPSDGIALHGIGRSADDEKSHIGNALLLKLNDGLFTDIKKASGTKDGVQFITGNSPKLRIGGRTIDLAISTEAFRNELYASTAAGTLSDLTFSTVVSHRGEPKVHDNKSGDGTAGSDAALAALQNSLASYEQEKQAKQSNIVSSVLPAKGRGATGKNRPVLGAQQSTKASNGGNATARAVTSAPSVSNTEASVRQQALRKPLIHLLAIRPASTEVIASKTHIPKEDLESTLQKIAKQEGGKWQLSDKAYRGLDVWTFGYTSSEDRQNAVDNAIRAYDRQRVGKDDKLWQLLLPKEERGKGVILSRLHGGAASQVNRGLTPNYSRSPLPEADKAGESKASSAVNTPKIGASTPRPASGKGDVMKRLLSKDPKKARAMEEAKEKKRKDREVARETNASDREGPKPSKRQAPKKENPKVKSAEIVHSSEDESGEEGEVREDEITRVDSKLSPEKPKPAEKAKGRPADDKPAAQTTDSKAKSAGKPKAPADPAKSIASLAGKAGTPLGAGKTTPRSTNGLSAPTSQHKSQRSPQKPASKPNVPSPLGAARPRVASDVSDRSGIGIQRTKQGVGTPQGLGISNGFRKRHDTVTSDGSSSSSGNDKKHTEEKASTKTQQKPTVKSSEGKPLPANRTTSKPQNGVKRKADAAANPGREEAAKHRKTDSMSSQSQKSHSGSTATAQSTARTSPEGAEGSGSDSTGSVLDSITYSQGVNMAEKFRDDYYPAYTKLYDEQAAKEAKGEVITKDERDRLWAMHRRLEQMKREIEIASQRGD
ncbi:hypothetical protein KC332_g10234 [Hortaea werneckii]|uniref:RNA polymerase II elongation factor ELL N-terminal domain-containing protein n=2 Tax=Hortaea werneckii TaxID=91943 RepID=A0A3M7IAV8_HORWE|nr:hypothetical protein KC358_g9950 [Hortaea werneckii]OTA32433.1 hypothetical protein BTJ68_08032 [Hortaea werneckii EXF-2000]KAI6823829.1 hypothetical protein KC350_g9146 [Hortaea werneckii]KAI6921642.1 hypothetical protein KC348_g10076 [Hortaea werneckii]KAI6930446.1 hypothetical protein KC341_g10224 [Hortaea werneckii]